MLSRNLAGVEFRQGPAAKVDGTKSARWQMSGSRKLRIGRISRFDIRFLVCFGLTCLLFAPSVQAQAVGFTLDFETGDLRGWTATGNAFVCQPTLGDNPTARHRGQPSGHQGKYWIGTFECYQGRPHQRPGAVQGDGPQGTLTSRPFTIPRGTLSFLVGGGSSPAASVRLLVETQIDHGEASVLQASGQNLETMRRVTWNLTPYAGMIGRLQIVDESSAPWGHINVDDFRFLPQGAHVPGISPKPPAELPPVAQPGGQPFVPVPDHVRRTVAEAKAAIGNANLRLKVMGEEQRAEGVPGTIFAQTPPARTRALPGSFVDVWVVAQPPRVPVPPVVGMNRGDAGATLSHARLGVGAITERNSNEESGTVLDEDPAAGTLVPPGTAVNLVVSGKILRKVFLQAANLNPSAGQAVGFAAKLDPEISGAEYQVFFGDGTATEWSGRPTASHTYSAAGRYAAHVVARIQGSEIVSAAIAIHVQERAFQVSLRASPARGEPNTVITFTVSIDPPQDGAEYRFIFGDGQETQWSGQAVAKHAFRQPGSYRPQAVARIGRGKIVGSNLLGIEIARPTPWTFIVAGLSALLLIGAGVYSLFFKPRWPPGMAILARPDLGRQELELPASSDEGADVRVRLVRSLGESAIEPEDPSKPGGEGAHE
jgi:PASTA domain/PKD domain